MDGLKKIFKLPGSNYHLGATGNIAITTVKNGVAGGS